MRPLPKNEKGCKVIGSNWSGKLVQIYKDVGISFLGALYFLYFCDHIFYVRETMQFDQKMKVIYHVNSGYLFTYQRCCNLLFGCCHDPWCFFSRLSFTMHTIMIFMRKSLVLELMKGLPLLKLVFCLHHWYVIQCFIFYFFSLTF